MMQEDFRAATLAGVRADIVLSDLAPNLSGVANVDQARAAELAFAAIDFCRRTLKPDGVFVVKTFHGEAFGEVLARLKREFGKVMVRKPSASRGESSETYVVARGLLAE
jgi:23S rRNA (uridine2552-2'-O)-methyltransferase